MSTDFSKRNVVTRCEVIRIIRTLKIASPWIWFYWTRDFKQHYWFHCKPTGAFAYRVHKK